MHPGYASGGIGAGTLCLATRAQSASNSSWWSILPAGSDIHRRAAPSGIYRQRPLKCEPLLPAPLPHAGQRPSEVYESPARRVAVGKDTGRNESATATGGLHEVCWGPAPAVRERCGELRGVPAHDPAGPAGSPGKAAPATEVRRRVRGPGATGRGARADRAGAVPCGRPKCRGDKPVAERGDSGSAGHPRGYPRRRRRHLPGRAAGRQPGRRDGAAGAAGLPGARRPARSTGWGAAPEQAALRGRGRQARPHRQGARGRADRVLLPPAGGAAGRPAALDAPGARPGRTGPAEGRRLRGLRAAGPAGPEHVYRRRPGPQPACRSLPGAGGALRDLPVGRPVPGPQAARRRPVAGRRDHQGPAADAEGQRGVDPARPGFTGRAARPYPGEPGCPGRCPAAGPPAGG